MAPETTPSVSERPLPGWADGPRLREIKIANLVPSPHNPRKTFDDLDELVKSVTDHGVLQPILVRPGPRKKFEIVAGERRYRAAKKAKLPSIPARVEPFTPDEAREVQIIENLHREDLTILEEATGFKALIDSGKYDVASVGAAVGKSTSFVYQRLKLLEAHPMVLDCLGNGGLEAGHVVQLARLDPETQLDVLNAASSRKWSRDVQGDDDFVSVRGLGRIIAELTRRKLEGAPWDLEADVLIDGRKKNEQPPPCVICTSNSSVQGGLFPEIQEDGICARPACYAAKWVAVVQATATEVTAEKGKFIVVRTTPGNTYKDGWEFTQGPIGKKIRDQVGGGLYGSNEYAIIPKGYKGHVPEEEVGIVAWSRVKRSPVGSRLRVTRKLPWFPKMGVEGAPTKKEKDASEVKLAERKKLLATAKAQQLAFTNVTKAIRSNVCWPPQDEVITTVIGALIDRVFHDDFILLARARGWVDEEVVTNAAGKERVKRTPWSFYDKKTHEAIASMDNQDLLGLAMEAILIKELTPDSTTVPKYEGATNDNPDRKRLRELGRVLEYDLGAEMKRARIEIKPKPKAKPKAKRKARAKKKA